MDERKRNNKWQKNSKPEGEKRGFSSRKSGFAAKNTSFSKPKSKPGQKGKAAEGVRINRFIALAGISSRREAEKYIEAGLVEVNGEIMTNLAYRVMPSDVVKYDGAELRSETTRFVLLNKPKDFITTVEDDKGRRTVMSLLNGACKERIYPVGRLDRNTTGVLLFTNDGNMAKKLTHPKHGVKKIYHIVLDKPLEREHLEEIAEGITLADGPAPVDSISFVEGMKKNEVGIEIHIGRNRIVRRIFEHFDYKVVKLDRVYFGGLTKKNLKRGQWRHLEKNEINMLSML